MTLQSGTVLNGSAPDGKTPAGVVLAAYGKYEAGGTDIAIDEVIEMVTLPAGAIVLGGVLTLTGTVFDATSTIDVGMTGEDVDCFLDGIDPTANGVFPFSATAMAAADLTKDTGLGTPLQASNTVDALVNIAASGADSVLELTVFYTMAQ